MSRVWVCLCAFLWPIEAIAAPKVIASVVPVHSIVAAVMGDTGQPQLLLKGALSEHRASFTASQLAELGRADLVFIAGRGLEAKLAQLSGSEAVNGKVFLALGEAPGVHTLPIREGGAWEAHDDEDHDSQIATTGEGVLTSDPHIWLDPENAKAMAVAAAAQLSKADPENAALYAANARNFAADIDKMAVAIATELTPVKDRPFIVFHDAYQYFERRFGLHAVGSITDVSAHAPSAERLTVIRAKLAASGAVCVFREPQYDGKAVDAVLEGSGAKAGILDPLGATLKPGPSAYAQLLRSLARALGDCLSG